MIISGIYKITNKANNKVYIGQSKNLNTRYAQHLRKLISGDHFNPYFQHSFNKYGKDNFVYEIIEYVEDLSFLNSREGFWVEHYGGINSDLVYNSRDPLTGVCSDYVRMNFKDMSGENNPNYGNNWTEEQKENLSKMRKGVSLEERIGKEKADLTKQKMRQAQVGRVHSEEVKEKIRQANIGEKNPAFGNGYRQLGKKNPMYGKNLSDEHKNKISNKLSGRKLSEQTKTKMSESAKKRIKSGLVHSEETKEKIRQANIGEKNPAFGNGYRQLGDKNPNFGKASSQRRVLLQFDKQGNLVKEYNFLSQVKDDGFHIGNVASAARGELKSSGGFIWKYKD